MSNTGNQLSISKEMKDVAKSQAMGSEYVSQHTSGNKTVPPVTMHVTKRNGRLEPVDLNKIVEAVSRSAAGLENVDVLRIATRTISGLYDKATTRELDLLSIRIAAALIGEEPEYSKLSARLLSTVIQKEVANQNIHSFSQCIERGHELGLINDKLLETVKNNKRKLNDLVQHDADDRFEFFGLRTVYDRYLLKHPETREVIETPQFFFLRVASALSDNMIDTRRLYSLMSSLQYMPSTPTLFNSGTCHEQLSSCFLLDSPEDDLSKIYERYKDIALLSKFSGGIGLAFHRIRSHGSHIQSTNGKSNGIIPWLNTLDASVAAVNQGGKRKGACCVYLESWHADVEDFLELRDNTGDEARRTHNLNIANWVPDLFMERVSADEMWSLFDPSKVPHFPDLFGEDFRAAYLEAESQGIYERRVKARDLYARMMRTLAQTGNGWITFKDHANNKSNQTGEPGNTIHLSNLCTEILEVTSSKESAVCNLGSVNLGAHVIRGEFDFTMLQETVAAAMRQLDRVIDRNYYAIESAEDSNMKWRPVGLGVMGLQDVFFKLRIPFESEEAKALSTKIQEEVYFGALNASCELSEKKGAHGGFRETRAAKGDLQFDLWGVTPTNIDRWNELKGRIKKHGLRNSLMIAIAPTATIASISGCYECIEPQISNLFKRETLSGDFIQMNRYLVNDLRERGLWTEDMRTKLKLSEGSIQHIDGIPQEMKDLYKTSWEISQRALIDMAAARGPYIDQSQSLNLFIESPKIGTLSSMYMHAWKSGVKTTYYLRSRPATSINKTTVGTKTYRDEEAVACSLENPEVCEACQ